MNKSLYQSVGGFPAISRIVLNFYGKVQDSDDVAKYFANVDMKTLIDHQTKFICTMLGGPASYTDDQLRIVHRASRIDHSAFDAISRLFAESLEEAGLAQDDISAILKQFEAKRPLVVAPL